ncbi:tRNA threonylcarbamoyladenosine biosynthesis protein TsaE [Bacillus pakistanensis]|uniref:tRNA threonylcarbamoyladenosine biosynthesis protein TsaE n=1 Tax=Rossellomorea pakistanensis TaxID=992288 RepID=A0ABS2NK76_9BACI|nr:tRNA (adenosine(37)-N6)-threonylcarbamoyltransferase complex ATPase subunit type 1 TsaE [Bacillus pakistanensis]MBM7588220.1 tRNA threonylcarbamoyladenosine biosynthesis protein TsaE [Bacillus pakistanensis]
MSQFIFKTNTPEETSIFAEKLASYLAPNDLITLEGDLGAGKTTFTKGLARGLGVSRTVNSPTFTIIKEYKGTTMPFYHMDVYRLEDSFEDLGFDEYFEGNGVTVVEWAHIIEEQLPPHRLAIAIFREGDTNRRVELQPLGDRYVKICEEIFS